MKNLYFLFLLFLVSNLNSQDLELFEKDVFVFENDKIAILRSL